MSNKVGVAVTNPPQLLRLKEIPKVAIEVFEYCDHAVGLLIRLSNKDDASGFIQVIVAPKVVGV